MSTKTRTDVADLDSHDVQLLLDGVAAGILTLDEQGIIQNSNLGAQRMFGAPSELLLGQSLSRWLLELPPGDALAQWLQHACQAALIAGSSGLYSGRHRDGSVIELDARVVELSGRSSQRYAVILQQASSDKTGVQDTRQTRRFAVLGRLAGGVAHDFNNLLMGVEGCIDVSLNKLDGDHPARKYLHEAKRSIANGASIVRQLLTFSRRTKAPVVTQNLDKLVEGTLEFLRRLIAANVELDFLPAAPDGRILFPEGALEEILMHLIVQVREILPEGGRLSFESGASTVREQDSAWQAGVPGGSYLTLRVSDDGLGGFADPAGRDSGGGLGAVCELIRHCGGYFELCRIPDLETALTIYFPRANPPAEDLSEAGRVAVAPGADSGGSFVLVVDDEPMIRMSLRSLLERAGYRVLEAHDGAAALSLCRHQREAIDVLLTDVVLPGMQGIQLAREVQALRPKAKVIFMSAYPSDTLVLDGRLEPGMISLRKPFDETALVAALRRALGSAPPTSLAKIGGAGPL